MRAEVYRTKATKLRVLKRPTRYNEPNLQHISMDRIAH